MYFDLHTPILILVVQMLHLLVLVLAVCLCWTLNARTQNQSVLSSDSSAKAFFVGPRVKLFETPQPYAPCFRSKPFVPEKGTGSLHLRIQKCPCLAQSITNGLSANTPGIYPQFQRPTSWQSRSAAVTSSPLCYEERWASHLICGLDETKLQWEGSKAWNFANLRCSSCAELPTLSWSDWRRASD